MMAEASTAIDPVQVIGDTPRPIARVNRTTRIWHWTNVVALLILLMSGLTIFNAHPRLYWGESGNRNDPAWFAIGSSASNGFVRIGSAKFTTTGVLGHWRSSEGEIKRWAFPEWATIPSGYSLAAGRRWHFFFGWVLALSLTAYMLTSLFNRHISRDLHLSAREWSPGNMWHHIKDHVRLRFDTEAGAIYNPIQKLTYIGVIFIALPLMIATGLTMSPGMNAALPFLVELFGGRQSARSIHFIIAFGLVGFVVVHLALIVLHRPFYLLRAITIGAPRDNPAGLRA